LYAVHPTFASSCWGKGREGHSREDRGETEQKEDRKRIKFKIFEQLETN
jgi:hypothetical protein